MPRTRRRAARGVTCSPAAPEPHALRGGPSRGRAGALAPPGPRGPRSAAAPGARGGRAPRTPGWPARTSGAGGAGGRARGAPHCGPGPEVGGRGAERGRRESRRTGAPAALLPHPDPGPTAAPGSCPARAGLCASLPGGAPAFPARQRPTPKHRCPGTRPRRAALRERGGTGQPARRTGAEPVAGASTGTRETGGSPRGGLAAGDPRGASPLGVAGALQKGSAARRSDRAPGGGARRGASPPPALCPGRPPLQLRAGSSCGATAPPGLAGPGASAGLPLPGKSCHRVLSAVTNSSRSPSLGRISVSEPAKCSY
ncbi:translation initiation factor IF-2-like [Falco biarmicus]|uniref:translation initiation factor IF-2-like n=1 Tax=Falco biarmicus TaxID=345155 RepID=UPI0024BC78A6|nr:translation initiation factor IF-2-like [Falco biarmicus]